MVKNSLTDLFSSSPEVAEKISTLKTAEEIFSELKKHISGYTEEQMKKDFAELKASAEIASGGELDAEALENVAGGAIGDINWGGVVGAITPVVGGTMAAFQETKKIFD